MSVWNEAGPGVWIRVYQFKGNPINTAVVNMGDGTLMAISPGVDVPEADFEELDAIGPVKALVSPGAFHHLGLPSWSARYPDADLFGPAGAVEHIAKQHPNLKPLSDLDALRSRLSDEFIVDNVDGCKFPDLFLSLQRGGSVTWFANELVSNNEDYPPGVLKWAFKLTGNHPGLNVNTLAGMLIRAKKPKVRAYFERQLDLKAPTRLVPTHGSVIEDPNLGSRLSEVIARRF